MGNSKVVQGLLLATKRCLLDGQKTWWQAIITNLMTDNVGQYIEELHFATDTTDDAHLTNIIELQELP